MLIPPVLVALLKRCPPVVRLEAGPGEPPEPAPATIGAREGVGRTHLERPFEHDLSRLRDRRMVWVVEGHPARDSGEEGLNRHSSKSARSASRSPHP